jgi:hypothetical protein
MKKIKSLEEALQVTGRPAVPEFADVPADMREYFQNQYKAIVIAEAINDGWKADWTDGDQKKWIPYFYISGASASGFVFVDSLYYSSNANAGYASRLCFESANAAKWAGENFTEIFANIILK